jgi:hypothetical protein
MSKLIKRMGRSKVMLFVYCHDFSITIPECNYISRIELELRRGKQSTTFMSPKDACINPVKTEMKFTDKGDIYL